MKKIGGILGALLFLVMIVIGIVQILAIASVFSNWFGGYFFIAAIIGMFISGIPLLATILSIYGAVAVWDWNIFITILLFSPMLIIYIPMLFGVGIGAIFQKIKIWLNS